MDEDVGSLGRVPRPDRRSLRLPIPIIDKSEEQIILLLLWVWVSVYAVLLQCLNSNM